MKNQNSRLQWVAILIVFFISGCAQSLVYWNQATEQFGQGAALEMENRFADRLSEDGDAPAAAVPSINNLFEAPAPAPGDRPEKLYRSADEKVSKALSTPDPLKKEEKLANALTLKALTAWKTGQASEARINAAKALQAFDTQSEPSPRDQPLAKAVPGLVALDLAYDSTKMFIQDLKDKADDARNMGVADAQQLLADGKALYGEYVRGADNDHSIAGAQTDIEEAVAMATNRKDVAVFLHLCQLSGLKNQFDFWAQMDNFAKRSGQKAADPELRKWISDEEESYLSAKDAALEKLKELLGGDTQNEVYRFWDGIL